MNLEDILVKGQELQQNSWTITRPKFGKNEHLEVVGFSGKNSSGVIYYIIHCKLCSRDSELFGQGYFRMIKGDINRGRIPCGGSKVTKWSKDQYKVLCEREADSQGYLFLGFTGEWLGRHTKLHLRCEKHGDWFTTTIENFVNKHRRCHACVVDVRPRTNLKEDSDMITSFLNSGAYHPDTKFWRSERKSVQGIKCFWFVECAICKTVRESSSSALTNGTLSCFCSKHRQTEAYINIVLDAEIPLGIKFGICAKDRSRRRLKDQNRKSIYDIEKHSVYVFPSIEQCKKSERECKQQLECGVFTREELADGHTETTWLYNLDKIVGIYESNGGVRVH